MSDLQPSPDLQVLFDRLDRKAGLLAGVSFGDGPIADAWQSDHAKPIITEWAKQRDDEHAAVVERLEQEIGELEWPEIDYSLCAYFTKIGDEGIHGQNTCNFQCHDEPNCITGRPSGGWPGENHPLVRKVEAELAALREENERLRTGITKVLGHIIRDRRNAPECFNGAEHYDEALDLLKLAES